jgi:hypothetical protein
MHFLTRGAFLKDTGTMVKDPNFKFLKDTGTMVKDPNFKFLDFKALHWP